jgi:hypothetical protein
MIRLLRYEPGNNIMETPRDEVTFVTGSVYPEDLVYEHFGTDKAEELFKVAGNLPNDAFIVRITQTAPEGLKDQLSKLNYGDVTEAENLLASVFGIAKLEKRKRRDKI